MRIVFKSLYYIVYDKTILKILYYNDYYNKKMPGCITVMSTAGQNNVTVQNSLQFH